MFKVIKNIASLLLVITVIFSCDKIEEPYMVKSTNVNNIDTSTHFRRILIEDYTGHTCGNCPRSHEKLQDLIEIYGNKLVPICMHVGSFAEPHAGTKYSTDYRTPAGDELNLFFGNENAGLPNGMINRFSLDGNVTLSHSVWQQVIDSLLNIALEADLKISSTYNASSNSLDVSVVITALTDITSKVNLVVYIKEDSLISCQMDYAHNPVDIIDYTHRYVMRGAINSTWGDVVGETGMSMNQSITKTYSYTLNSAWNASHCKIVAFVYYDDTKVIIQADEQSVL